MFWKIITLIAVFLAFIVALEFVYAYKQEGLRMALERKRLTIKMLEAMDEALVHQLNRYERAIEDGRIPSMPAERAIDELKQSRAWIASECARRIRKCQADKVRVAHQQGA